MSNDVVIAPARRLNQSPQTSVNDWTTLISPATIVSHPETISVSQQVFNDDVIDTVQRGPEIADATARNQIDDEQHTQIFTRSLVGKKSNEVGTITADQSMMHTQNLVMNKHAADIDQRFEVEKWYNGVWMPFETNETLDYNVPISKNCSGTDINGPSFNQ
jgi:hypothetical protein